jgi:hypothetical protein
MTITKEKRNLYQKRWLETHKEIYAERRKERDHRYYLKRTQWLKFLNEMPNFV